MTKARLCLACLSVLLIGGCSTSSLPGLYTIDVPQGNYIDPELIDQLRPGMSQRDVRFLLGSPLINDPFHPERWDYYYSLDPDKGDPEQRHLTLFFRGDVLERYETHDRPEGS